MYTPNARACTRSERACSAAGGSSRRARADSFTVIMYTPNARARQGMHARTDTCKHPQRACLFCGGWLISTRTSAPPGACRRAKPSRSTPLLDSLCMRGCSVKCRHFCTEYATRGCVFGYTSRIKIAMPAKTCVVGGITHVPEVLCAHAAVRAELLSRHARHVVRDHHRNACLNHGRAHSTRRAVARKQIHGQCAGHARLPSCMHAAEQDAAARGVR